VAHRGSDGMATRQTRAEKKAETRERLLAAAERLAATKGLARVTLEAVAEAAGVTKGAIYSNFESKEELLLEAVLRLTPGLELTAEVADATTVTELLERLAVAVVDVARTKPKQAVLAAELDALAMRDPKLRRALVEAQRAAPDEDHAAENWLTDHAGELPLPPQQFAEVVNALGLGLIARRLIFGAERVPDELFRWAFSRLALRRDD
jgi:AcrR family transcriptional regulator